MPFLPLFTGIRHLAHVLTVPPTKARLLCATPAGIDLYIYIYTGHACRHFPSAVFWISEDRLLCIGDGLGDWESVYTGDWEDVCIGDGSDYLEGVYTGDWEDVCIDDGSSDLEGVYADDREDVCTGDGSGVLEGV